MALQESGGCFLYCCCFLLSPNAYGRCQPAPRNILVLQSSPRFVGFVSWLGNNKTGHLQFYQSSSDIPVVGKSTDEKLILEQAGSGYATFPFFLCFCVLGVNASESKKCFDKKRGKITWKACPLPHTQGRYLPSISIFLPCIAKSGKEPRPYWNLILFWNYVQFGIFLRWESLACSSFPLTVLCRVGDLGWISVFCAYKAAGASMAGLECVVSTHWMWKKPLQLHTDCGFCLYSVSVISLKSKSYASVRHKSSLCYFKTTVPPEKIPFIPPALLPPLIFQTLCPCQIFSSA